MADEYILREEDGEVLKCDSCDFPAPTGTYRWGPGTGKHDRSDRLLCRFCAETMAGRYTEYPTHDTQGWLRAEVWRAAACVFNMLKQDTNPKEPT